MLGRGSVGLVFSMILVRTGVTKMEFSQLFEKVPLGTVRMQACGAVSEW